MPPLHAEELMEAPAIVGAVYYFGDELDQVVHWIKRIEHGIFFVAVALVLAGAAKWWISHRRIKPEGSSG